MAQQHIIIGTPNSNNGDFVRDAFLKVEANFTEVYSIFEPLLGNPSVDNQVLTSLSDGTRSWQTLSLGGTYDMEMLSGTGVSILSTKTPIAEGLRFDMKKIESLSNNLLITETTDKINLNLTGSFVSIDNGSFTTVTGTGSTLDPFKVNASQSNVLTTDPTSGSFINNKNPSKSITLGSGATYSVTIADNNYVIEIDNGANNVTIDLSNSFPPNNFFVGFVQKGTGSVLFTGHDIFPEGTGSYLYGQGHIAALDIVNNTKYLHGTLKAS